MDAPSVSLLEQLRGPSRAAAWVRFVNLYTPLLREWAERRGFQAADTADLVQNVFVKLMYEVPRYKPTAGRSFRAWLAQVLTSAGHDYRKRKAARALSGSVGLAEVASPDNNPAEELEEADYKQKLLRRGLDVVRADFNDQTWAAFSGVMIDERPAEAVASGLGISESAVYLARHRVLTRLRQELEGFLD
ncbi:MAG: sigma-70 family RNA polymerase sigma factor [Planctomycetes bacterium]|nr:sigma-70 family RNA polymerase sigma factor [Planctomycetota bacterium]